MCQDKGSLSNRLKVAQHLFDIISGVSIMDHPLCKDCADEMLQKLDQRLEEITSDNNAYAAYLERLKTQHVSEESIQQLQVELSKVIRYQNVI